MTAYSSGLIKKGEEKLATLLKLLIEDRRREDIYKAVTNEDFRRELYREYGIPELFYIDMPISKEEVYADLEESRKCFERGEYRDFDDAIEEIKKKYNL